MSSFVVPTSDPGAPQHQNFPDVVRGPTIDTFLRRDRFVYATSRRLIATFSNYSTTAAGAVNVYQGYAKLSALATGKFWIVGYAEKGTVSVNLGGSWAHTYGTTAAGYTQLVTTALTAGAWVPFLITVTKTAGQPYVNLYGLSIYEDRLAEADLP